MCGNYMGRGEAKNVDKVYSISLKILTVMSIILTVVCISCSGLLANAFHATEATYVDTKNYIIGLSIGILPMLIMPCLMTFLQMCNKSGLSLLSTIILTALNTIFNLLNVHIFHQGIFGIGLATSLSKYCVVILMLLYFTFNKKMVRFDIKAFDLKMVKDILILGSPASLAGILYSIRNVFINSYALKTAGTVAVDALAILTSCGGFLDSINIGVGATFTMLASVFVGEKDSRSLKDLMKISVWMGIALCMVRITICYLLNERIPIFFGGEGELISVATELIILYNWSSPFNIVTLTLIGVYQTVGRIRFCNAVYLSNCILVPLFCCTVLANIFGIRAIWLLYTIAEIVTLAIFYINACIQNKKIVTTVDELIYLGNDFDATKRYNISINKIEEVVNVSREIESFCKDNGIDSKRAMLSGLCAEEMAGNIVEHGFKKDKKKNNMIDVLACVENDEVYLRMRDNCVPFDPHTKLKMYTDDPLKNVGIKMVSKIAKQMNYQTTFGMNVLTIKL